MPQSLPITGSLVGSESYEYKAFTPEGGTEVPGGTSYHVYVSASLDGAPDRVKVDANQYVQLHTLGFGADVQLMCEPVVQRGRVGYKCLSIRTLEATGVVTEATA